MRELFQSRRRSANISGAFVSSGHPNSSPSNGSSSNPRILLQQHQRSSRRRRQADQQRQQQQHLGSSSTRPLLHPRLSSASTVRRSGGIHLPGSSRNTSLRSTTQRSNQRSTTQQSHSQPSTATMTDFRSASASASSTSAVPTYVHGAASAVSRFSFDDETSWMSGVESHAGKSSSVASTSACSATAGAGQQLTHYLRDRKATKRVIDDLNKAQDRESTLTALSIVCVEFDHNDTIKHNAALYYGAADVLSQKLPMTDHHTDHEAIRMICAAIEMAFRGGSKYVKEAFRVNIPNMMPPLLRLLDKCEQSKIKYADECILNITKTFHYISRIPELRVSLARQPGLLEWLQRVATTPLDVPSRNVRVRLMANLANCDDNKVFMFAHKGLVTSLLRIAQYDLVDATREYASIAIMDLASAPVNQIPLAKNGHVLKALTALVVSEKIPMIRESATTTLQNLAFPKSNRKRLVQFHDGVVLEALLSVLAKDPNEKTRRRAAGALTNLAFDETAESMANHTGLLKTLARVSVQDDNQQVQSRACLALTKIASSIGLQSKHYAEMLDALVIASASKVVDNCNISAMFRLKAREAECRESMARHEGLLNALADMCMKPHHSLKDRDNATRALMHLANENVNRKIMCNDRVLEALVSGASLSSSDSSSGTIGTGAANNAGCIVRADDPANMDMSGNTTSDHDDHQHLRAEIQDSAIRAIARLATEFSNRGIMAKHEGLITSIAKATERESKLEAQSGGANSSSRNQPQSFLGKPLLMTLLMAM